MFIDFQEEIRQRVGNVCDINFYISDTFFSFHRRGVTDVVENIETDIKFGVHPSERYCCVCQQLSNCSRRASSFLALASGECLQNKTEMGSLNLISCALRVICIFKQYFFLPLFSEFRSVVLNLRFIYSHGIHGKD